MKRFPPAFWLYALFSTGVACGLVLFVIPRAVAPSELPALTLAAAEVEQVLREDARLAASAPKSGLARQLFEQFVSFGQTEAVALEDAQLLQQRRRVLHSVHDRVVAELGPSAALTMRAWAVEQFDAALDSRLKGPEVKGLLGVFPNVLAQHLATRSGIEIAPHFVVRTLYKARWNRMLDLPVDDTFARIEKHAYFGWLGLHAENLPVRQRRQALLQYAAAGGPGAAEAQGVLAFLEHDFAQAVDNLQRAYAENPSLRLRNYLRGARVAADHAGGGNATAARAESSATQDE